MTQDPDPVGTLRRWAEFGAVWEVVHRSDDAVTVSLRRCDGGEEVSRLVSGDPALREYVDTVLSRCRGDGTPRPPER